MPVKKPQDHLPKKDADEARTVEVRGVTYTIDEDALDDWELLEAIALIDSGSDAGALQAPRVLKAFLGATQYATVLESLRVNGRVSIEAGAEFLGDLIEALDPNSLG